MVVAEPTHWNPSAYRGAADTFKRARVRECCILLGRTFHRESTVVLAPTELTPYAPAIASALKTILYYGGTNAGAYAFLLKDCLLCCQAGWKEAAAMMLGLADRFLDPHFNTMRHWGSETFVQSIFAIFNRLSTAILENRDTSSDSNLLGQIAQNIAGYGLSRVPGVPNAGELFSQALGERPSVFYSMAREQDRMLLVKESLLNPEESNPHEYKIEHETIAQAAVCPNAEELLDALWAEYERLRLHGPLDSSNIVPPSLGDFGESPVYRMRMRSAIGEIVCPFYAARFESGVGDSILLDQDCESDLGEVILVGDEDRLGTRVVAIDVKQQRFLFEFVAPSADRETIQRWLPGMGGDWRRRHDVDDEEKGKSMRKSHVRTFIVHGHADSLKWELKNYLQSTLGLPEPTILHEQANLGRAIMDKFEDHAGKANLAFVLLTPDDVGAAADSDDPTKRRARQNVIFELGYFLGLLRRESGRVILLHQGPLELPSDISGLVYIDVSGGIDAAGEKIRRELAGIDIESAS